MVTRGRRRRAMSLQTQRASTVPTAMDCAASISIVSPEPQPLSATDSSPASRSPLENTAGGRRPTDRPRTPTARPVAAVVVMGSSRKRAARTATVSGCVSMMIEERPADVSSSPLAMKAWNMVPSTRPKSATAAQAAASRGSGALREAATPQRMSPAGSSLVTATKSGEVCGSTSFVETIAVPQRANGRTRSPRPRRSGSAGAAGGDTRSGSVGQGWRNTARGVSKSAFPGGSRIS